MDSRQQLDRIKSDLGSKLFELSLHALERMSERSISAFDIIVLIESKSLQNPWWSEKHKSWNFTGRGLTSDEFTIACVYKDEGTLIVTVFWE